VDGEFNMQLIATVLVVCLVILTPDGAKAYVGPGLGAGTVSVILGILGSIFIALFAIVWYPLKRLLARMRKSKQPDPTQN
jgi:hypothetical protein